MAGNINATIIIRELERDGVKILMEVAHLGMMGAFSMVLREEGDQDGNDV